MKKSLNPGMFVHTFNPRRQACRSLSQGQSAVQDPGQSSLGREGVGKEEAGDVVREQRDRVPAPASSRTCQLWPCDSGSIAKNRRLETIGGRVRKLVVIMKTSITKVKSSGKCFLRTQAAAGLCNVLESPRWYWF